MSIMSQPYRKQSHESEYVLFVPRSRERLDSNFVVAVLPNWEELARMFEFHILRARKTQATVAATQDSIERLKVEFPSIEITSKKKFLKLSPSL